MCGLVVLSVHEPEHTFKLTTLYIDKAEDPDFFVYFWHQPLRIGDWPDHADSLINANRWHQYELIQE